MKHATWLKAALGGVALAALALLAPLGLDPVVALDESGTAVATSSSPATSPASAEQLERGRQLALAGHCAGCHTARGSAPYAGGTAIETPFGTVYAGNLTPDDATGIGRWTPATFWRALHHGQGADGRRLVPAFPYTEFTRITRADSDALYAWLRSLPAVVQANHPHALRWPYGTPTALAAWRLLFFSAGEFRPDPAHTAEWNRGAYLVNGPGHCVACHGGRNALGAIRDAGFGGGLMAGGAGEGAGNWYAPALNRSDEAGVADWPLDDIVALLQGGAAPRGRASGPMAEVVSHSTQHLPAADLRAMAVYLQALPAVAPPAAAGFPPATPDDPRRSLGASLYKDHCAACHGEAGEGGAQADGRLVVPPLAGNRIVAMNPPANLVRAIALGGFGAATATNPRPYGMPPYGHVLGEEQIACIATFLRSSWGHAGAPVSSADVTRWRGGS
ncbi:MAG: hypothetical protein RIQ60_601 [Pseudomonadota bacterium]|jgi:mono/diheme cytochrome c family protein